MIGLDSSFVIDFLKNNPAAVEIAGKMESEGFVVSPITIYEVLVGIYSLSMKSGSDDCANEFFDRVETIPLTSIPAKIGAKTAAKLRQEGIAVSCTDMLIAADLKFHGCNSIISNDKDFSRIKGWNVINY